MFRTVTLDPPWAESGGGKIKRGADRHYGLMKVKDIAKLLLEDCPPLQQVATDAAHAYMWYTDNYLKDALWLLEQIGFRYVRTFQWVKVKGRPMRLDFDSGLAVELEADEDPALRCGIGQYGRGAHEGMLFGVRGKGQSDLVYQPNRDVPSAFLAPHPVDASGKRIHSRKPDASYELIQRRSKGPYLELFARRQYGPDWTCWGNEVPEAA